ncbi:caspase family protein [Solirubrobacter soli]|uniref:caspase family protein n=1 Tax=Solirubrobacter soli TaxID=363832 RepID=UPI0004254BC0|nr:caspase family protein [Solirubrobacter soli]
MPEKTAVCIGLNHYAPESDVPPLRGCVDDALLIGELLVRAGFSVQQLHDSAATYSAILETIGEHVERLRAGDELVVWNASHGFQVPDLDGDEDADVLDEAICTYDNDVGRPLSDDRLAAVLARARSGTRVFVGSDSCHSGTLAREAPPLHAIPRLWDPPQATRGAVAPRGHVARFGGVAGSPAEHLLLAGCEAGQVSWDAKFTEGYHGAMTYHFARAVLAAWDAGQAITYAAAHQMATAGIHATGLVQNPQLEGMPTLKAAPVFGYVPR